MEDKKSTIQRLQAEKHEAAERDSSEMEDADLEQVSSGTIVLDE